MLRPLAAVFASGLLIGAPAPAAADAAQGVAAAREWRAAHGAEILAGFAEFLAIPNVAGDAANINRNADWVAAEFTKRGFKMERLEIAGASPLLYGAKDFRGATGTIAIYAHYDGQPVNTDEWTTRPFEPALYSRALTAGGAKISFPAAGEVIDDEWRLYARSAGDDKAPFAALLAALDALDAKGIVPTANVRLVFDGEEEAGSEHLADYLKARPKLFEGVDLWLFCDGPKHQSGRAQLVFGARGSGGLEITVYGPNRGLHSGHYGNWAPGPGWRLARLLASMKDDDGRVLIKDFYKSTPPLSKADKAAIAALPPMDDALRNEFGLAESEMHNAPLAERLLLPALNLHGLKSAEVGANTRNVIPPTATASIGLRFVEGNDPKAMLDLVEAHVARQGFHIVRDDPDAQTRLAYPLIAKIERADGYGAVRSRMDDPAVVPLIAAIKAAAPDLLLTPMLGGSLPLPAFQTVSAAPIVILPIANFDDNQHSADENIRLGDFFYGIDAYAAVLTGAATRQE